MSSNEAVPRAPWVEHIREDLNKLKLMWALCCGSPLLYLGIANIVRETSFSTSDKVGFLHMDTQTYKVVLIGCLAAAAVLQVVMFFVRRHYAKNHLARCQSAPQLVKHYTRQTLTLAALSEVAILMGFVLFLLQGDMNSILVFGIVGMICYAQSYPSERALCSKAKL